MVSRATFDFLYGLKSWRARSGFVLSEAAARVGVPERLLQRLRAQVHGRYDGVLGSYELRPGTLDAWGVHGSNEAQTHAMIGKTIVGPGGIMIDVGGYIGYFSLRYRHRFDHIYVFEPFPANADALARNIALNQAEQSVTLVRAGVAATAGIRSFYLQENDTHSLVQGSKSHRIEINVVTLDGFVASQNIDPDQIRLIKIDVEGAELDVLKGAASVLKKGRPQIVTEANTEEDRRKVASFLADLGYRGTGTTDKRNFWYSVAA